MIKFAFSFIIILFTIIIALLSNPFLSSIFIINNVFGQEPEIYIVPGAGNLNNNEGFIQPEISVPINTIVTWLNDDYMEQTITADDDNARLFDSGPISPGDTFENAFDSVGKFGYHCSIHPFIKGIVLVE